MDNFLKKYNFPLTEYNLFSRTGKSLSFIYPSPHSNYRNTCALLIHVIMLLIQIRAMRWICSGNIYPINNMCIIIMLFGEFKVKEIAV